MVHQNCQNTSISGLRVPSRLSGERQRACTCTRTGFSSSRHCAAAFQSLSSTHTNHRRTARISSKLPSLLPLGQPLGPKTCSVHVQCLNPPPSLYSLIWPLTLRFPFVVKALPQIVQPNGFSPVWVRSCICSALAEEKVFPHD